MPLRKAVSRARTSSGESLTGAGRSAVRVAVAAGGASAPAWRALGMRRRRPLVVTVASPGGRVVAWIGRRAGGTVTYSILVGRIRPSDGAGSAAGSATGSATGGTAGGRIAGGETAGG